VLWHCCLSDRKDCRTLAAVILPHQGFCVAITISDSFVVSVLTLIPTQLAPLPPHRSLQTRLLYCNSLYYNLPKSQVTRLQQIQNSLARAVVKTPKCCHITPILHSLHWLKITERIEYKLLSLTYKVLTTTQPPYLHNLISVQPPCNTHSSSHVTLARAPTSSSLRITDRSFRYASPCLWNQLPSSLRQPHSSPSVPDLPVHVPATSSYSFNSPLSPSITPSLFHSWLKTYLFTNLSHHRLPSSLRTDSTALWLDRFFWASRFLCLVSSLFFFVWFHVADLAGYMLAFGRT